jgi:hypothetical protein
MMNKVKEGEEESDSDEEMEKRGRKVKKTSA